MKEIQLRLEIIRLAVELGDHPTIDHQVTHLRNMTTDTDLHAILDDLQRHNFHQALFAMDAYEKRQKEADDFFAGVSDPTPEEEEESTLLGSESLFDLETPDTEPHIIGVDEMLAMTRQSATAPRSYIPVTDEASLPSSDPDPEKDVPESTDPSGTEGELFDLSGEEEVPPAVPPTTEPVDEPLPEEVTEASEPEPFLPEPAVSEEEGLFDLDRQIRSAQTETPENTFLPTTPTVQPDPTESRSPIASDPVERSEAEESVPRTENVLFADEPVEEAVSPTADTVFASSHEEERAGSGEPAATAPDVPEEHEPAPDEPRYEAFAYMGQKFRNMLHQFPQKIPYEEGVYIEAQRFIDRVSTEDYTESQVEAMIARYQELKAEGHLAEAAQVLIAAATTESRFAQFMLARELFKGEVLKPDHAEAFTQINRMAEEDYPEAICDLGQLYEYGIGIDKNKHHALLLYEEAAAMGIERAQRHYERLRRANPLRSITSLFSRR